MIRSSILVCGLGALVLALASGCNKAEEDR